jgi:hypothetical protein
VGFQPLPKASPLNATKKKKSSVGIFGLLAAQKNVGFELAKKLTL